MECPICFENYDTITHKPMVSAPCGHTTCITCCATTPSCPLCRTSVSSWMCNYGLLDALGINGTSYSIPSLDQLKRARHSVEGAVVHDERALVSTEIILEDISKAQHDKEAHVRYREEALREHSRLISSLADIRAEQVQAHRIAQQRETTYAQERERMMQETSEISRRIKDEEIQVNNERKARQDAYRAETAMYCCREADSAEAIAREFSEERSRREERHSRFVKGSVRSPDVHDRVQSEDAYVAEQAACKDKRHQAEVVASRNHKVSQTLKEMPYNERQLQQSCATEQVQLNNVSVRSVGTRPREIKR